MIRQSMAGALAVVFLLACGAQAQNTFTNSGYWDVTTNWSLGHVPTGGEVVVINANVTLTNATAPLAGYTLNAGKTNTFGTTNAILYAVSATVSGTVTHVINTDTNTYAYTNNAGVWLGVANARVTIVCTNFTLATNGTINVNGKGYQGATGAGIGYGPGSGWGNNVGNNRGSGAGYGAAGGAGVTGGGTTTVPGGPSYGSTNTPVDPGSGGGGNWMQYGGNGGGSVILVASSNLVVNGTVSANGTTGGTYDGGGSGGGIYVICGVLTGSGSFRANGGTGGYAAGAGGRIALNYGSASNWTGTIQEDPGGGTTASDQGTLYVPDMTFLPTLVTNTQLRVAGPTTWNTVSLVLSNSYLRFVEDGFHITVTNNCVLQSGSRMILGHTGDTVPAALDVGGDLILTNASTRLWVYSARTNGSQTSGATISVTGTLFIATGATNYLYCDPTNGASVLITAGGVTVASNAAIMAAGAGYGYHSGTNGYGPGGGGGCGAGTRGGGGGYGGKGGTGTAGVGVGGQTYGVTNAPVDAGSSGGSANYVTTTDFGGNGGGVVILKAAGGTVRVDGTLSAAGANSGPYCGGGAGGSVFITCQTMAGYGAIVADGGAGNSGGGGGGGGRVAILYSGSKSYTGPIMALAGAGGSPAAVTGTVYMAYTGVGTYQVYVQGAPVPHGTPTPYTYGANGVSQGATVTNTVTSPADELNGTRYRCTGWMVTNAGGVMASGGTTQAIFAVTSDCYQTWLWIPERYLTAASGANGALAPDVSGWYTNGSVVTVTPVASNGYHFSQWTGAGVPGGAYTNNPLIVTMDQPRSVQANFASDTPQTKTWTGAGTWPSSTNWSPAGMPGLQDTATISSGSVTLDDPVTVASLTVNGTLVFNSTNAVFTASDVTVNGTVTHNPNTATNAPWTMDKWVSIACSNLTVASGGAINVSAKGYGGLPNGNGFGPGGGGSGGGSGSGGGYGGSGGSGNNGSAVGVASGTAASPDRPGSGGGGGSPSDVGGFGGGFVRIRAVTATIDGAITAIGGDYNGTYSGAGSGGGIDLACQTFQGAGRIDVRGGTGTASWGGSGGGGRMAVVYATATNWTGSIWANTASVRPGVPGTVYASDMFILPAWRASPPVLTNCQVRIYGAASWTGTDLTVSNSHLSLAQPGVTVTLSNNVTLMAGSTLVLGEAGNTSGPSFFAPGALTLTGGSQGDSLWVYGGMTNATIQTGAVIRVGGALTIGSNSVVYPYSHPTNGGSVFFSVGALTVNPGGQINASGAGFQGRRGGDGYGTGGGKVGGPGTGGGGGGYGGAGGDGGSYVNSRGGAYGSSNAPIQPGSAGGGNTSAAGYSGGAGGGLVWMDVAGAALVNGTIVADGSLADLFSGGGAGGAIRVSCIRFKGAGALHANGGNGNGSAGGGGGGGGRIAISCMSTTEWFGALSYPASVTGGVGVAGGVNGSPGSVVWRFGASGSIYTMR